MVGATHEPAKVASAASVGLPYPTAHGPRTGAAGELVAKVRCIRWTGFDRTVDHPIRGTEFARGRRWHMTHRPTMTRERIELECQPSQLGTEQQGR